MKHIMLYQIKLKEEHMIRLYLVKLSLLKHIAYLMTSSDIDGLISLKKMKYLNLLLIELGEKDWII